MSLTPQDILLSARSTALPSFGVRIATDNVVLAINKLKHAASKDPELFFCLKIYACPIVEVNEVWIVNKLLVEAADASEE